MQKLRNSDWDTAYRFAQGIDFPPQRVIIFQKLAQKLHSNKETDRAQVILEEVWGWVEKLDNSPKKVDAMFKLAEEMALINTSRSFELLERATKALNSTGFSVSPPKDPNRVLTESQIAVEMIKVEPIFTSLARVDFDRTIHLAQTIANNEMSLFAQSAACQQILRPNSK